MLHPGASAASEAPETEPGITYRKQSSSLDASCNRQVNETRQHGVLEEEEHEIRASTD